MLYLHPQKRIYLPEAVYFVTTVTKGRVLWFWEARFAEVLLEQFRIAKELKGFRFFAYVIMPDHLHLLLQPNSKHSISEIMFTIKKHFSHEANRMLGLNAKGPIHTPAVGEQTFARLRQMVNTHPTPQNTQGMQFQWQKSFHDHIIRDQRDFNHHIDYIHFNPVKDGLVDKPEDWPYSSYKDFVNGDYSLIDPISFD